MCCTHLLSQYYFQNTYTFDDQVAKISNVYPTDSAIYFSGISGQHPYPFQLVYGKLNPDGVIDNYTKIESEDNVSGYMYQTEFEVNYRGNLVSGYTASPSMGKKYPKFVETDFNGNIIDSFSITQFYAPNFNVYGYQILPIANDSTYIAFGSYYSENSNGLLLFKFNQSGDTLWSKKIFTNTSINNSSILWPQRIVLMENGTFLFSATDYKDMGLYNDPLSWARIHFYKMDESSNILKHAFFQNTQICYGGHALATMENGAIGITYLESKMFYNIGHPQHQYRPVIAKLDSNFHLVWKDTLRTQYFNIWSYSPPADLVVCDDGGLIGAYHCTKKVMYDSSILMTTRLINSVNLVKYTSHGELQWKRKFHYIPITDSLDQIEYIIYDMDKTSDGGFIACGEVVNYTALNAQALGRFAYVLKVNCLGFMGPPEAYLTHEINEGFSVNFFNSSLQAGSYEWDFGDGSPVLWTGEKDDSIHHQYNDFGPYIVTLIAHGCNGETDTLKTMISPALHLDPTPITTGQGYFALFPNPVSSGNKIIVYLSGVDPSLGDVRLELYSQNTQLVRTYSIGYEEGSYLIDSNIAAGMYHINLIQDGRLLQSRKLVVE